jgi:hypothetical protein
MPSLPLVDYLASSSAGPPPAGLPPAGPPPIAAYEFENDEDFMDLRWDPSAYDVLSLTASDKPLVTNHERLSVLDIGLISKVFHVNEWIAPEQVDKFAKDVNKYENANNSHGTLNSPVETWTFDYRSRGSQYKSMDEIMEQLNANIRSVIPHSSSVNVATIVRSSGSEFTIPTTLCTTVPCYNTTSILAAGASQLLVLDIEGKDEQMQIFMKRGDLVVLSGCQLKNNSVNICPSPGAKGDICSVLFEHRKPTSAAHYAMECESMPSEHDVNINLGVWESTHNGRISVHSLWEHVSHSQHTHDKNRITFVPNMATSSALLANAMQAVPRSPLPQPPLPQPLRLPRILGDLAERVVQGVADPIEKVVKDAARPVEKVVQNAARPAKSLLSMIAQAAKEDSEDEDSDSEDEDSDSEDEDSDSDDKEDSELNVVATVAPVTAVSPAEESDSDDGELEVDEDDNQTGGRLRVDSIPTVQEILDDNLFIIRRVQQKLLVYFRREKFEF